MARRKPQPKPEPSTAAGVPADLAAGPCVELWADPGAACPLTSARANWRAARDKWCRAHGLTAGNRPDWHHMPPELRDRAPFHRPERNAR